MMNEIINSNDFKKDKYLFSLVSHNLEFDDCQIISDNNYAIIVGRPNKEIWLWANSLDDYVIDEMIDSINDIIKESDYSFVCKKNLYNKLREKVDYISDTPFIYDNYICKNLIEPRKVEGILSKPSIDDKEVIAKFWKENCEHLGYDISYELCLKFADSWVNSNTFYVWKNNDKIVSFLGYDIIDNTAEISHAYTDPNERGKGYMPYLIYEVTKIVLASGLVPVLNTDYSYESSNNAYKKVGFQETELMYSFFTTLHKSKKL